MFDNQLSSLKSVNSDICYRNIMPECKNSKKKKNNSLDIKVIQIGFVELISEVFHSFPFQFHILAKQVY